MKSRFQNGLLPRIGFSAIATVAALFAADIVVRLLFTESLQANVAEMTKRKAVAQSLLASNTSQTTQKVCRSHPFFGHTMQDQMDATPLGWRLVTDRNGFRNPVDFDIRDVPDDVVVIGLFGGSAAFGWEIDGNDGTLASRLEDLFNSAPDTNTQYRVVNLGIPGWHYPQQFFLISRIIQHLDGIITYDGFNEIMVPVGNTLAYKTTLPPDFPSGLFYLPIFQKQSSEQILAMYGLLMFEADYEPDGLLAYSAIYNKWRHMRWDRKRNQVLELVQSGTQRSQKNSPFEESMFARDIGVYDELIDYGIDEHAKYSHLVDLISKEYDVPILHVLQPFLYVDPGTKFDPTMVPAYSKLAFANGHPSIHYAKLRKRFSKLAKQAEPQASVQYLDLSDALGEDPTNWIDLVHPSPKGNRVAAEKIMSFVESSQFRFAPNKQNN